MVITALNRMIYKRRRNIASKHTAQADVRERIFGRDNNQCVNCGGREHLTIDHIISVYRGGVDDDDNLQTLCNRCNAGKAP